ncbi:carbohydrate-binding family 9-like protein [uncultured Sphaerochaeta sp.]|uniref:carbohydrate-binding family 9-like protein n=1 Tax=uncultured Sphaerochaeta sp. TaxID=886478 RepID=UPI002A0A9EB7|nr:carbohydrate-binding family 9-like protein [uncultured Sphaerochaeta sp.]
MEEQMLVHVPKADISCGVPLLLEPQWNEQEGVQVSLRLSHDERFLLVRFSVVEKQLLRMCTKQNDPVYTDSCVEVFLQKEGEADYINFEFSASGNALVGKGKGRQGRTLFPVEVIDQIPISVTILENTLEQSFWKLEASLDLFKFGLAIEGQALDSLRLKGNFYKCGDNLKQPHYLAYGPIGTVKPDFHTPSFFVPIVLM